MIYVPPYGPTNARIMLVGEAPGADEESHTIEGKLLPRPFVGVSGRMLDGMLAAAGIDRTACFVTNAVKYRPPRNHIDEWLTDNNAAAKRNALTLELNGMHCNAQVIEGIAELKEEIKTVKPECIVALGNTPLWALTGEMGITKWRGSELWYDDTTRLIPTLHPAAVLRALEQRGAVIHDLRHRVVAKMDHPELGREPDYHFQTGRVHDQVLGGLNALWDKVTHGEVTYLANDIETKRGRIDCYGFAWSTRDALCVPMVDATNTRIWNESEEREVVALTTAIMQDPRVKIIGQNFNYDAQYYVRDPATGIRVDCFHDTKVAQHCLLPGTDKDLVTLSSLYCDWHRYWKDDLKESAENMDDEQRWRYNCRDNCVTFEVAMKQLPMLKKEGFL